MSTKIELNGKVYDSLKGVFTIDIFDRKVNTLPFVMHIVHNNSFVKKNSKELKAIAKIVGCSNLTQKTDRDFYVLPNIILNSIDESIVPVLSCLTFHVDALDGINIGEMVVMTLAEETFSNIMYKYCECISANVFNEASKYLKETMTYSSDEFSAVVATMWYSTISGNEGLMGKCYNSLLNMGDGVKDLLDYITGSISVLNLFESRVYGGLRKELRFYNVTYKRNKMMNELKDYRDICKFNIDIAYSYNTRVVCEELNRFIDSSWCKSLNSKLYSDLEEELENAKSENSNLKNTITELKGKDKENDLLKSEISRLKCIISNLEEKADTYDRQMREVDLEDYKTMKQTINLNNATISNLKAEIDFYREELDAIYDSSTTTIIANDEIDSNVEQDESDIVRDFIRELSIAVVSSDDSINAGTFEPLGFKSVKVLTNTNEAECMPYADCCIIMKKKVLHAVSWCAIKNAKIKRVPVMLFNGTNLNRLQVELYKYLKNYQSILTG